MLSKTIIIYPEEILNKLYQEFSRNNMGIYTFEEFCFVRYGQYITEYQFQQRRWRTDLLWSIM